MSQYACPQQLESYTRLRKAPPYHVLYPEPRLLHYVFVRIFYPKDHSREASNEIALEAIYRLMNGYSVDYASVILNHMYRIANLNRNMSILHWGLELAIPMQPTDHAKAAQHADQIIQSTTSAPTFR